MLLDVLHIDMVYFAYFASLGPCLLLLWGSNQFGHIFVSKHLFCHSKLLALITYFGKTNQATDVGVIRGESRLEMLKRTAAYTDTTLD